MGIGIVLLLWAIIGSILAGASLVVLGGAVAFFTKGVTKGRTAAIVAAGLFPFACLAWAGAIFFFQAFVNEGLLHRDAGLGDAWRCPLPNGYAILMIDVTDYGSVYNPKTQGVSGAVGEQEDAVFGVRLLQIAGPYILGGVDSKVPGDSDESSIQVDSYFVLDARTGKRTNLPSYEALNTAALQFGVQPKLEPIQSVYARYRFSWFDVFVGVLFCSPILITFLFLVRRVMRLRQTRGAALQSA